MTDGRVEVEIGADVASAVKQFNEVRSSFAALSKQMSDGEAVFKAVSTVIDGISFQKSLAGLSDFERTVRVSQERFRAFAATANVSA